MLTFVFWSCSNSYSELQQPSGEADFLIFITHGSGDSIEDWPTDLAMALEANLAEPSRWDIWLYDWSEDASNKLTASGSGIAHGEYISEHLQDTSYTHYHLIGHSVGSFIIHTLEEDLSLTATVQSTYLDPFCGLGLFDWEYGHRHFGEKAHFSEAYINMDDGVPSSDSFLEQAFVFDMTAHTPSWIEGSQRHWWPIEFYMQSITQEEVWGFSNTVEAGNPPYQEQPLEYPKGGHLILE